MPGDRINTRAPLGQNFQQLRRVAHRSPPKALAKANFFVLPSHGVLGIAQVNELSHPPAVKESGELSLLRTRSNRDIRSNHPGAPPGQGFVEERRRQRRQSRVQGLNKSLGRRRTA